MVGIRTVAAVVSLVNGAWGVVSGVYATRVLDLHSPTAGDNFWIIVVGVILLLDSVACVLNVRMAFAASGALSVLLIVDVLLSGASVTSLGFAASALLGVVTIVLDVLAVRHSDLVSEENHPLNLPVFG